MGRIPLPRNLTSAPRDLVAELAARVGEPAVVGVCVALLEGADPVDHADVLPYLAGRPGATYFDGGWRDHWPRVWGARGLLYVWDEAAAGAVLAGLGDGAWRVAEMCLKVAALRELPAGDQGVRLARHGLPRVRAAAVRALGVAGDVEHVEAVRTALGDEDQEVRCAADRALGRMTGRLDLPG
jgi:hypothetical protein